MDLVAHLSPMSLRSSDLLGIILSGLCLLQVFYLPTIICFRRGLKTSVLVNKKEGATGEAQQKTFFSPHTTLCQYDVWKCSSLSVHGGVLQLSFHNEYDKEMERAHCLMTSLSVWLYWTQSCPFSSFLLHEIMNENNLNQRFWLRKSRASDYKYNFPIRIRKTATHRISWWVHRLVLFVVLSNNFFLKISTFSSKVPEQT